MNAQLAGWTSQSPALRSSMQVCK